MMQDPLFVKQFTPSVRKQPLNTHYQVYQADSASASQVNWNIDSPFSGALLDNEVYVKWTIGFNYTGPNAPVGSDDFRGMYDGSTVNVANGGVYTNLPALSSKLGLRPGWAVHGGLSNCEVVINGQSLHQTPTRYMPEFARFYGHPAELHGVCTMSGGELDCGSFDSKIRDHVSSPMPTAITQVAREGLLVQQHIDGVMSTAIANRIDRKRGVPDKRFFNDGFQCRVRRLHSNWRDSGVPNAALALGFGAGLTEKYAQAYQLEVYERLPISPFMMWEAKDKKRSIPYVDKMEVSMTFSSNYLALIFQSTLIDAAFSNISIISSTPEMHLKWYIPPPGSVMPPEISIPVSQYKESVTSNFMMNAASLTEVGGVESVNVNYENLRLQQIPDLLLIYVKPSAATHLRYYGAEHHLEITDIEITVNGDSGKVRRANSGQLFSMYCRNSPMSHHRSVDYEEWRKRYCTLALTPADLGVRVPPGVNHGVTLDVRCTVRNWWSVPGVGLGFLPGENDSGDNPLGSIDGGIVGAPANHASAGTSPKYELTVLGIYDKYELTLTNRGNAQLKLQNVPSLDLPQALASVDRSDLRAQFA